jgi:uncharacterized protein with FMN-binding domain
MRRFGRVLTEMNVRILFASAAAVVVAAVVGIYYLVKPSAAKYRDGVYKASSQSIYKSEQYWGEARVEITDHDISKVDFYVLDKGSDRRLDLKYCNDFFSSNAAYLEQCHNDLRGMKTYTQAFAKAKDLKKIHALAGATWSYRIFEASVGQALAKAE